MKYKGYEGSITFDEDAEIFHGEVINTRDVITFQGRSVTELKRAFKESVEDYLEFCAKKGQRPEKPFSGNLVIRIDPELHRKLAIQAKKKRKSLNAYIEERLAG
jgi:predicted HicB family RNase H-like nuclease